MSSSFKSEEMNEFFNVALKVLCVLFLGTFAMGTLYVRNKSLNNNFYTKKYSQEQKKKLLVDSIICLLLFGSFFIWLGVKYDYLFLILIVIPYFYFGFSLGLFIIPWYDKDRLYYRLTSNALKTKVKNINVLEKDLISKKYSPIGLSLTTKNPVYIESQWRNEHILITGSTGSRKSSAAITLRRSDYINNRAVIDIDPKGDSEDLNTMKKFAELYGRGVDFYHFNISDPLNSWGYDPLEIGSKRAKIDKLIYALELNHEHYSGIAQEMLSLIFDVCSILDIKVNIYLLSKLLISKEELFVLFERIYELPENEFKQDLMLRIGSTKSLKNEDLKGLRSKIGALSSIELKPILNPKTDKKINLFEVIDQKKIAYFQLNTLEYKGLNRVLARFILSDLGILANKLSIREEKSEFVALYIDEALSVIDESFPEYLRMVRSARISITMILQTLAKLNTDYGDSFKDQLLNETKYSLHFESSVSTDAEAITLIPGTIKMRQRSFAVDSENITRYSGRGTESDIEVKLVESNILRALKKGQCLFFDRQRKYYDVIESWSAKTPNYKAKTKAELFGSNFNDNEVQTVKNIKWTQEERLLSQIHPKDWLDVLNYEEFDLVRKLKLEWQNIRGIDII